MEIYLVGGAVRDKLLNLDIKDRDWLVIGATPAEMLSLGYRQVGKDFPVFLHPKTQEEYALGRIERKIGRGHQAFSFDYGADVTIEEDLYRRDLTINAIAESENGDYIDPYHGLDDIKAKKLRHVSVAFAEDPLRVLRVFRFLARFQSLGFSVASETLEICRQLVTQKEMEYLTAERVWLECEKSLQYQRPEAFFAGLYSVGALSVITQNHPITQQQLNTMNQRLMNVCRLSDEPECRFAIWLSFIPELYQPVSKVLPLPIKYKKWIELLIDCEPDLLGWQDITAEALWRIFKKSGSLRKEGAIAGLVKILDLATEFQKTIENISQDLRNLDIKKIQDQGYTGANLGKAIQQSQQAIIETHLKKLREK